MSYNNHAINVQPASTSQMTLVGQNPKNTKNLPYNEYGKREWTHGLCGCLGSVNTFVMATCFPCITYGKNKSRLKYLQEHGEPHPSGGNTCTGDCWLHCCLSSFLPCCGWILQLESRNQIRNRYSVDGGCGSDCVSSFFCSPCALTQEHQEMQEEEQLLMRTMGPNVKSSVKRSFEGRRP